MQLITLVHFSNLKAVNCTDYVGLVRCAWPRHWKAQTMCNDFIVSVRPLTTSTGQTFVCLQSEVVLVIVRKLDALSPKLAEMISNITAISLETSFNSGSIIIVGQFVFAMKGHLA